MTNFISLTPFSISARKALVFFVFTLNSFSAFSQNLLPNPSFEEIDTCPTTLNKLENAVGWIAIMNSPDYFNKCASGWQSIPNNLFGFQNTLDSFENGYAGLIPSGLDDGEYHEMMGINITESLVIGKKYYFSFNYSSGYNDLQLSHCNCFNSHLGMKMLTNFTDTNNLGRGLINDSAILFSESIFSDSVNWNLFAGSFIADSAYKFLIIGNFFTKNSISNICLDSSRNFSYTFIDNVCLSSNEGFCFPIKRSETNSGFIIFPSIGSGIFIVKQNNNLAHPPLDVEVFNCLGKLVKNLKMEGGELEFDLSFCAKGIYFLRIENFVYKIILT